MRVLFAAYAVSGMGERESGRMTSTADFSRMDLERVGPVAARECMWEKLFDELGKWWVSEGSGWEVASTNSTGGTSDA